MKHRHPIALFVFYCSLFVVAQTQQECEENWAGSDCTVFLKPLSSGEVYTGTVRTTKWNFFSVDLPAFSKVIAFLVQLDEGDCNLDFYIQKETLPRFNSYLLRDISEGSLSALTLDKAQGKYFFGIFGYQGCSYSLQFSTVSVCQCSSPEKGDCLLGGSECHCFSGFGGPTCDIEVKVLSSGQQIPQVNVQGWTYYTIQIDERPRQLQVEVLLGGDSEVTHKADLFIAAGRLPSFKDFDSFATSDVETRLSLLLSEPEANTLFNIGVYTKDLSTFQLIATIFPSDGSCLNQCSNHGTCINGECECESSFSGLSCENMDDELTLGTLQRGNVGAGAWNRYQITLETVSNAIIKVEQSFEDEESDCDMYVKKGSPPNFYNYDAYEHTVYNPFNLTLPSPGSGTWHIGLYAWSGVGCEYTIVVQETMTCNCAPFAHGFCFTGEIACVCEDGWGGEGCDKPVTSLENGVALTNLELNRLAFFSLQVPKSIGVTVAIRERRTVGNLWLYVSVTESPSLISYDAADKNFTSTLHQIDFTSEFSDHTLIFGVFVNAYGSTFCTGDDVDPSHFYFHPEDDPIPNLLDCFKIPFDIVAWHTPF